nr:MAG TPA: hypothetical protein [Caudoviricetes sp.]
MWLNWAFDPKFGKYIVTEFRRLLQSELPYSCYLEVSRKCISN